MDKDLEEIKKDIIAKIDSLELDSKVLNEMSDCFVGWVDFFKNNEECGEDYNWLVSSINELFSKTMWFEEMAHKDGLRQQYGVYYEFLNYLEDLCEEFSVEI